MSKEFEIARMIAIRECREVGDSANAYAWSHRIYPIFSGDPIASVFSDGFEVSRENANKVTKFVDDDWMTDKKISFYDIEAKFDARYSAELDRSNLIGVLRYTYLSGRFDDELWSRLTTPGSGPVESQGIADDFDPQFDARVF